MTIRPIVKYPDRRLGLAAAPVTVFGEELRLLADDLLETMLAAPGVGITAPHIGVSARLVVLKLQPTEPARFYVNPTIAWSSAEVSRATEGSVSMPGVTEEIERPARVRVAYQDLAGAAQVEEADGFLATCHQHEIDQLDGIFWINRLSRLKREMVVKRYQKLAKR